MLRGIVFLAEALLLALVGWNLLTSLPGLRAPVIAPPGPRQRRFRMVVPAHNEEAVIAGVLADISGQHYPSQQVETWVLADRCTDRTASRARAAGARAAERTDGPDGKSAALSWYLDTFPLTVGESLVVVDADNRLPPDLLARFADELDAGHRVLQAYLDVVNPDDSWLATAGALSYWASNRMVQLARSNLGWTADLGGTGMCLPATALATVGGLGSSQAEDQDLTGRLLLAGIRVRWLHDVRVRDEKPTTLGVAFKQRARWLSGKRQTARSLAGRLVEAGFRRRSLAMFDFALRLVQPSRAFVALLCGILLVLSSATASPYLFSWPVWATATALQFLAPLPFLLRDGVPMRYVWRYPLLAVFGALFLPVWMGARRRAGWYHTPHGDAVNRGL